MLNEPNRKGFLLVISSPSGGGKTTIYKALLEMGEPFAFSVSATTRPPRSDEVEGIHYYFISDERFDEMIVENKFAEWAVVHSHRYGTPRESVENALRENKVMIFDIDVQGAAQLKAKYPKDTVLIFVAPPSATATESRLKARKTDSQKDIELRMKDARQEIEQYSNFDYLVYNDKLEDAIADVLAIVNAEKLAVKRFCGKVWPD